MNTFKIIAITHKTAPLELIGLLHLDETHQHDYLTAVKLKMELIELMFLSTCNRVEFVLKTEREINRDFLQELFSIINSRLTNEQTQDLINAVSVFENKDALTHLFEVSSSLDSLVVGEREIITQVRKAYEFCNLLGLTGDTIRLAIKQTIETAKQVYTDTDISKNPVSIVSLANRQLRSLGIKHSARILFIGAGETNKNMAQYLKKNQYTNFVVFNRSLTNAQKLATDLKGIAYELTELENYKQGFDVIITCTSAQEPIINTQLYKTLVGSDTNKKVIIDLALPADIDKQVLQHNDLFYIDIEALKKQANANLLKRENEIDACKQIILTKVIEFKTLYQERRIELAFNEIPKQIKYIKETALNEVFSKEIDSISPESKAVLEKVLIYMEKKYNALAIKTAKKVFLEDRI